MRAKAKTILIAAVFATALYGNASAQPAAVTMTHDEKCAYLSTIDADKLHQALTSYAGEVMGKEPERWEDADYINLATNADACNGQPVNIVNKVNADFWRMKLADAQKINAEINRRSLAIASTYAKFWTSEGPFPACASFLHWKRDDIWLTNNSKELFGKSFMEMTPDELGFYKRVAQECEPVMGAILDRWRRHPSQAEGIVKSIVQSIELDALAAQEKNLQIPQDMVVMNDGSRIPIAYLRPTTQKVVKRVLALEKANRVMPTNSLLQISKWADQLETEGKEGPDLAYARTIKSIVASHLFRSADQYRPRED